MTYITCSLRSTLWWSIKTSILLRFEKRNTTCYSVPLISCSLRSYSIMLTISCWIILLNTIILITCACYFSFSSLVLKSYSDHAFLFGVLEITISIQVWLCSNDSRAWWIKTIIYRWIRINTRSSYSLNLISQRWHLSSINSWRPCCVNSRFLFISIFLLTTHRPWH